MNAKSMCGILSQGLSLLMTNLRDSDCDIGELDQVAKATTKAMSAIIMSCNKTKLAYIHAGDIWIVNLLPCLIILKLDALVIIESQ